MGTVTTRAAYGRLVAQDGLAVPSERPLVDLAAELTTLLGSPAPAIRDELAYPTLSTRIDRGVLDDLLTGFGDGLITGLRSGMRRAGLGDLGEGEV